MKIKFLGTSHGRAEVNRYCTSYMFEHNGKNYLIDVGAPVEYLLTNMGLTLDKVTAYFITHMHCDHASELPTLIKNYVHYNKGKTTIYMPDKNAIDPLLNWSQAMGEDKEAVLEHITFKAVNEGVIYNENGIPPGVCRFLCLFVFYNVKRAFEVIFYHYDCRIVRFSNERC